MRLMNARKKAGIGAALACLGALGFIIGPTFGLADLSRPWSFLIGFVVGVVAGLGATLAVAGLIEIVESLLKGDARCTFAIHLPEDL